MVTLLIGHRAKVNGVDGAQSIYSGGNVFLVGLENGTKKI